MYYSNRDVVSFAINDERIILFDTNKEKVMVINRMGHNIWEWLKEKHDLQQLITEYIKKYDVEETIAQVDIGEFISKLYRNGFIVEKE